MVYLQNTPSPQTLLIPRSVETASGLITFRARSTVDLADEVDVEVVDLQVSGLYYFVAVSLPEGVPDGEYEYTLAADDNVLSSGLLVIGGPADPSEYNKEVTYEQYETKE